MGWKRFFGGGNAKGGEQGLSGFEWERVDIESALHLISEYRRMVREGGAGRVTLPTPDWGMRGEPAVESARKNLEEARRNAYGGNEALQNQLQQQEQIVVTEISRLRQSGKQREADTLQQRLDQA
jgi:hypothetical protein